MKSNLIIQIVLLFIPLNKFFSQYWQDIGVSTSIHNTMCIDNQGNLYAVCDLTDRNTVGVAKWNGMQWMELGSGTNTLQANGAIKCMTTDYLGNLYVAGLFTNLLGEYYVAKWDGVQWIQMGTGFDSLAYGYGFLTLTSDPSGNIYAAGDLLNISGHFYIAKWDGISWNELGAGIDSLKANHPIFSLCSDTNGNIYAAGSFSKDQFPFYSYVAKWDGNSWSSVDDTNSQLVSYFRIYSIAVDLNGHVYAAGEFENSLGKQFVAEWDGTQWSEVGGLNALNANGNIYSIQLYQNTIYANGNFKNSQNKPYLAKWNGSQWAEELSFDISSYNAKCVIDTNGSAYISRGFKDTLDNFYIAKWNGSQLSQLGLADNNFAKNVHLLITDHQGNLYGAGGNYSPGLTNAQGEQYVGKWNGTKWEELGTGTSALHSTHLIRSITADSAGNVYASYFPGGNIPKVVKWDGTQWTHLNNFNGITGQVEVLAVDKNGTLFAGGQLFSGGNYVLIKRSGNQWVQVGGVFTSSQVVSIAFDNNNDVYVVTLQDDILKLVGNQWISILDPNYFYRPGFITSDRLGNIFALNGPFSNKPNKVLIWDGSLWAELGSGANALNANDNISSLAFDSQNNVYAVGSFTNAQRKSYVAKWDGTSWSELGIGKNSLNATSYGNHLVVDVNDNLYALNYSYYPTVSIYSSSSTAILEKLDISDPLFYPNPAYDIINLKQPYNGNGTLSILDINGNLIRKENTKTNDFINISDLKTGVYLIKLDEKVQKLIVK